MNKQEFETLAKVQVTDEQYRRAERIYMGAPNVDKEQFAYEYKRHKLSESETVCDMAEANEKMSIKIQNLKHDLEQEREIKALRISELEEYIKRTKEYEAERKQLIAENNDLALVLLRNGLDEQAIAILGHACVISLKCCADIELSKADKVFIAQTFRK